MQSNFVINTFLESCFRFFYGCLLCVSVLASRAKLSMLNTMSKIRGQVKSPGYPQAEGLLGECMAKYGRDLGEDTNFGGFQKDIILPFFVLKGCKKAVIC